MATSMAVLALILATAAVYAEERAFHVPETISKEARTALANLSISLPVPALPEPDDLEGWKRFQTLTDELNVEANAKVVERYEPHITRRQLGGVPVMDIEPKRWNASDSLLVYVHGGGYVLGSANSTFPSSVPVAAATGLRIISVDYTLAPFAKWQETTDQVVAVMMALVEEGHRLGQIAIYGDSAGGGLAAGAVLKMRDRGQGMPAAVVLWSPWSDVTNIGDTHFTLRDHDPVILPSVDNKATLAYADPADHRHPYVSPVYGDYSKGFPPTLIQVGTKEVLLSGAVRHYQALDTAGIEAKLDVFEGMWHVWQAFNVNLPESDLARQKVARFLEKHMGKR